MAEIVEMALKALVVMAAEPQAERLAEVTPR